MSGKKKKKLRVAFRKNRQKKPRARHALRHVLEEQLTEGGGSAEVDLPTMERVSGKGELTRHRTIIGIQVGDTDREDPTVLLDVDESECLRGRVLRAVGLTSMVQAEDGRQFECTVRRILRTLQRDERNPVVAGDRVLFRPTGDAEGVIERVELRSGILARASHGQGHIIAANVDQVAIVASVDSPPLKPSLIDRFLISAEKGKVRPVICINKVDLVDAAALEPLAGLYAQLGYDVVLTSAVSGIGLARLKMLLQDRQTVFAGQSGVGKSALLNAIQPGLELRVGEVSEWSRKGRHTTRRAELLPLDFGGWVVDTPGIRQMELWDVMPEEVEGFFVEFRPFVPKCKFPDCSHTHERDCGVKRAVACGLISQRRYESYCRIFEDEQEQEEL